MSVLPGINITVSSSSFDSAQLGSARWYTFGTDQSVQSICLWQGVNIYSDAYDVITTIAPNLRRQDGITEAWRAPLDTIASTWPVVSNSYIAGSRQGGLSADSTIRRILARPMSSWSSNDKRIITAMIVWVAEYSRSPARWANAQINIDQVQLPPDATPLPMGDEGYPEPITNPNVSVPPAPVCYPPNTRLDPVTGDTSRAFPQSLGTAPFQQGSIAPVTIPLEPAMSPGGDFGFFGALAAPVAQKVMSKRRRKS